jgi:hypothetical protein
VPTKSIIRPISRKQIPYAIIKAVLIRPYCCSVHPMLFCSSGARMPRAARSMYRIVVARNNRNRINQRNWPDLKFMLEYTGKKIKSAG